MDGTFNDVNSRRKERHNKCPTKEKVQVDP